MDFGLNIFNGITALDLERDCLASKRLNEDLHASAL